MCGAAPKLIVGYSPLNHAFVDCDCGMQTALKDTGEEVTAMWNRRSPTPQADAAPIIGQHDISTSTGGRAYIAEFFAKRLRRHDFQRYIEERLAADFACALAGYLSEHVAAIAAGGAQEPVAQWQSRPLKSNHEWINLDEADAKRIAERHSDIYEVRALYAAPLPRVAATVASPVDSLVSFHAEQLEGNPYCYFELAYTRQTGWMAWITDRPAQGEPGTAAYAKSRKVIVRGQGETAQEACADALSLIAAASNGDQA
jgi:hypothetical protein